MPGGDRTGPMGWGPRTGRAAGYCSGYPVPGYMNPYGGRGGGAWGWAGGWGRGRGYRHWYYATGLPGWARGYAPAWGVPPAPPSREQESEYLRDQAKWLREQLSTIEERLADLGRSGEEEGQGG